MSGLKKAETTPVTAWLARLAKNPLYHAPDNLVVQQFQSRQWLKKNAHALLQHPHWKHQDFSLWFNRVQAPVLSRSENPRQAPLLLSKHDAHTLVFHNGYFERHQSHIGERGITLKPYTADRAVVNSLGCSLRAEHPRDVLLGLSLAYSPHLYVLRIAPGFTSDKPIIIHHVIDAENTPLVLPRILLIAGERSRCTVIETVESTGTAWMHGLVEAQLAEGSHVSYVRWYTGLTTSAVTSETSVMVGEKAQWHDWLVTENVAWQQLFLRAHLTGDSAGVITRALSLVAGKQQSDAFVHVEHHAPHTTSEQVSKWVLDGQAAGTFIGTVKVNETAVGSVARQVNRNVLMAPTATMHARPNLDILTDDVQCSHGSATGALDEKSIQYMRSRGIDPETATRMLLQGFVYDVLETIPDQRLRNIIMKQLLP